MFNNLCKYVGKSLWEATLGTVASVMVFVLMGEYMDWKEGKE